MNALTLSPDEAAAIPELSPDLTPEEVIDRLDASAANGPAGYIISLAPAVARLLLRRNTHNRKMRDRAVADYARDMSAGEWPMNGEAIKVATDGTVLDGQHRLHACKAANATIRTVIIVGLDPKAQETMDSGRRRTAADVMQLRGETHSSVLAATTRRAWAWTNGDRRLGGNVSATKAEMTASLDAHPELRRSAEIASRVRNAFPHIPQSILGLAHFLFNAIDPDQTAWFFQRLADGAELPAGHPLLALRNRVTSERAEVGRMPEARHLAYLIRAWNAMRTRRSLGRLVHPANGTIPDPQ